VSFTDDDLEAILGGKSTSGSIHDSPEAETESPPSQNEDSDDLKSLKQLRDQENKTIQNPSATYSPPNENRGEEEINQVIRAANSLDSGVYVESSKILINPMSDPIQRRGGFSLDILPDPEMEESCKESSPKKRERYSEDAYDIQTDEHEVDNVDQKLFRSEKRKDSVLENSSDCSGDVVHDVTDSLDNLCAKPLRNSHEEENETKCDAENLSKQINSLKDNDLVINIELSMDRNCDEPFTQIITSKRNEPVFDN